MGAHSVLDPQTPPRAIVDTGVSLIETSWQSVGTNEVLLDHAHHHQPSCGSGRSCTNTPGLSIPVIRMDHSLRRLVKTNFQRPRTEFILQTRRSQVRCSDRRPSLEVVDPGQRVVRVRRPGEHGCFELR